MLDGESFYDTNTSESLSSNSPENLPPENVAINLLAKSDSKDQDSAADSGPHFSPQGGFVFRQTDFFLKLNLTNYRT